MKISTPQYHAVRFYDNDKALAQIVADFLGDGLTSGEPGIVVASPTQRAAIIRELVAKDIDVVKLQGSDELIFLDAEETLSTFMANGTPDGDKFKDRMCEIIKRTGRGQADRTIRIYGQMVDLLWKNGKHQAAIRLEMLWNQLANGHAFSLLCGYAMGHFYKDANFHDICARHTHVLGADGRVARVA